MASFLRLFDASQGPEETSQPWTLRRIYLELKLPELRQLQRRPSSLYEYTYALSRWDQWKAWDPRPRIANEPPGQGPLDHSSSGRAAAEDQTAEDQTAAEQITRAQLIAWRAWLLEQFGARTANRHLAAVLALLRCAADHEQIARAPRIPALPAAAVARKLVFSAEELSALYRACSAAAWPLRSAGGAALPYSAAAGWRALLVLLFNYGFRTQELVAYEAHMMPLAWSDCTLAAGPTPDPDGQAESAHGWLQYVPLKQRRFKAQPLALPLNAITAGHLRSLICPLGQRPDRPVFDWPHTPYLFYATWRAIRAAAGLRHAQDWDLKHFRKTANTAHEKNLPGSGGFVLGHAARGVNARHYLNAESIICQACETLPQPEAFATILESRSRQRLLF